MDENRMNGYEWIQWIAIKGSQSLRFNKKTTADIQTNHKYMRSGAIVHVSYNCTPSDESRSF